MKIDLLSPTKKDEKTHFIMVVWLQKSIFVIERTR